tara:strand:+ start:948 stop:2066 length:1119 start_codon:yes stop_codon:yes gene_type:complete
MKSNLSLKLVKVPIFDPAVEDTKELISEFDKLLKNGQFILGKNVQKFEENLSKFLNSQYVVGVNSGTDALELGLKALKIKNGDYVITTGFSYFATVEAIYNVGGKPYVVDIDRNTLQIDIDNISHSILQKAKFIIPVHLFGGHVDVEKLLKVSKKYNLKIVEDVAQSFGTKHAKGYLGTVGSVGAFSFYPTKTLGAIGDAGAVTTNKKKIYEDLLKLRNHGHIDRDNFKFSGKNSRLDEIQAIFLNKRLKTIKNEINNRVIIAKNYKESLEDIENIKFYNDTLKTFNYFPITVSNEKERDSLVQHLEKNGIGTAIYYKKPLSDLNFDWIEKAESFKNINYIKKRILCLPIYSNLDEDKINYVVEKIRKFYGS